MEKQFNIFLTPSTKNRQWRSDLIKALQENDLTVWSEDFEVISKISFEDELRNGLDQSYHIVFVLDQDAVKSNWTAFLMGAALATGKPIISVMPQSVHREDLFGPLRARYCLTKNNPSITAKEIAQAINLQPEEVAE